MTRVYDDQITPLFQHGTSQANNYVYIDRGSGYGSAPTIDRLIIPAGHTISGACYVEDDDNSGFTSAAQLWTGSISGGGLEAIELTSPATQRYVRFRQATSGQPSFAELFFTGDRQPSNGPEPRYEFYSQGNLAETELVSGDTFRVARGPARRILSFTFRNLSGTDLTIFDDLETETEDGLHPFYVFPADDSLDPIFVELMGDIVRQQVHPRPGAGGEEWTVTIAMRERLS